MVYSSDDPITKRLAASPLNNIPKSRAAASANDFQSSFKVKIKCTKVVKNFGNCFAIQKFHACIGKVCLFYCRGFTFVALLVHYRYFCQESQTEKSLISQLQKQLEIPVSLSSSRLPIVDELKDKELLELASTSAGEQVSGDLQVKYTFHRYAVLWYSF